MPKFLMSIGFLLLISCASSTPADYDEFAHNHRGCNSLFGECNIVQSSPLCSGLDRQTCRVIVYEAQESDAEQGYGTDRLRVRKPSGY